MLSAKPTASKRFAGDSDEELLFYMSLQADDVRSAEEAWEEFVSRHGRYVLGVCQRFRKSVGDGVDDLAQETLIRVYKKAHTFTPLGGNDANRVRARIRAWLGQIANRLFLTTLRGQPDIGSLDDEFLTTMVETAPEANQSVDSNNHQLRLLREALCTLTDRERGVLLASYGQEMTSDEVKALAERFQTTPTNIRQIRCRGFAKLKQYVAEHTRNT